MRRTWSRHCWPAGSTGEAARWAGASATWTTSLPTGVGDAGAGRAGSARLDIEHRPDRGFAGRDKSEGKQRTALLVAGLAGLGRIDAAHGRAAQPAAIGLGLGAQTGWTRLIDGAAAPAGRHGRWS